MLLAPSRRVDRGVTRHLVRLARPARPDPPAELDEDDRHDIELLLPMVRNPG
jgi:hypothetical protein